MAEQYIALTLSEVERYVNGAYSLEDWLTAKEIADKFYGTDAVELHTNVDWEYNDEGGEEGRMSTIEVYSKDSYGILRKMFPTLPSDGEDYADWNEHDLYYEFPHYDVEKLPHKKAVYDLTNPAASFMPTFYMKVGE